MFIAWTLGIKKLSSNLNLKHASVILFCWQTIVHTLCSICIDKCDLFGIAVHCESCYYYVIESVSKKLTVCLYSKSQGLLAGLRLLRWPKIKHVSVNTMFKKSNITYSVLATKVRTRSHENELLWCHNVATEYNWICIAGSVERKTFTDKEPNTQC